MDDHPFDSIARLLSDASSRRGVLQGLAAATLGLAAISLPGEAEGRKKRKNGKRNKKKTKGANPPALQLNDFQCVDVGNACRGNSANCCSGICEDNAPQPGKPDTSVCVAHNVGECQAGQDSCTVVDGTCGTDGVCLQTTGKASFCASAGKADAACSDCTRDPECEALFGDGAACVVCEVEGCLKQGLRNICRRAAA
jgi:hypothetical protein